MRRTAGKIRFVLGMGWFAALGPPLGAQTNLLLNSSFEWPAIGSANAVQGAPQDWNSTGSTDYLISNGFSGSFLPATDGSQIFYFFSGASTEAISQGAIELAAGQTYEFTFDLSKNGVLSSGTVIATVSDGTDSQSQSFSVSATAWSSESWNFTAADSGAYTLTLAAGTDSYPAIDNLALTAYSAVPEQAESASAVGIIALGAGLISRRGVLLRGNRPGGHELRPQAFFKPPNSKIGSDPDKSWT